MTELLRQGYKTTTKEVRSNIMKDKLSHRKLELTYRMTELLRQGYKLPQRKLDLKYVRQTITQETKAHVQANKTLQ